MPRLLAALLVVTACGSRGREAEPAPTADPTVDPAAEVTPAPTPVRPAAPAPRRDDEWPSAPTRVVTDRIGDLAFTLTLPNELQGHPNDRTERSRGWEVVGWPLTQPRFEVTRRDEPGFTTVEAGREAYADDRDHVASATLTDGRFTLVVTSAPGARPAEAFVSAYVVIPAGAGSLECFGTHGGAHLTAPAVIGPWLAATCATLTVTPR